jgi:very-short-patch-repair endonuclease
MNAPEKALWARLRQRVPGRLVFRRQHPFPPYVLDFYCMEARLSVEVDGWPHTLPDRIERDETRDAWLNAKGVEILRVPASEVMNSADAVAEKIWRMALERGRLLKFGI